MANPLNLKIDSELIKKFEDKIFFASPDGCWYWIGITNTLGYGRFSHEGKEFYAHRISYLIYRGQFSIELDILHSCDNPLCVNPNHLFLGTHDDNMKDMAKKGRAKKKSKNKGEKNPMAKLTYKQVLEIRAINNLQQWKIGEMFGVSQSRIHSIRSNKCWKR